MDAYTKKATALQKLYHTCTTDSSLHIAGSTNRLVFGSGNPDASVMIIGEAPGAQEEIEGKPFVGRSGQLLDRLLHEQGNTRSELYITNIVKIRPPKNRTPTREEINQARPILMQQIDIIKPRLICTLGASALAGITLKKYRMNDIRGKIIKYGNLKILPIFHPAYVLRCPSKISMLTIDVALMTSIMSTKKDVNVEQ